MGETEYLHGGEIYALARSLRTSPERLLDFSSNANVFAFSLTETLVKATPYPFAHYPDSACPDLREAIARHEGMPPSRILPGNGAAELIWFFLQNTAPRHVLFVGPIFSEYVKACASLGIQYSLLPTSVEDAFGIGPQQLQKIWETPADLVVLCTPNNPAAITYPNFHTVLSMLRAPRVLIDNSYREFLYGSPAYDVNKHSVYMEHLRPGVSLFTLNSFTKFFCSPGIRLGYLMGDSTPMSRLAAVRPSWMVPSFAQLMGVAFLDHITAYRSTLPSLYEAVEETAHALRQMESLFVADRVFTGPGFLCCGLQRGIAASALCAKMLELGIILRNCDTIPGMPKGFVRIQARSEKDRNVLASALGRLKKQMFSGV